MKILLINPTGIDTIKEYGEDSIDHRDVGAFPPLGLLYIAAYLRERQKHEIKVFDGAAKHASYEEISNCIKGFNPDVIGITSFTHALRDVIAIAQIAKSLNKNTHICLGGHHPIYYPKEAVALENIDSIVYGEGEVPFFNLVNSMQNRLSIEGVAGVFTKKNIDSLIEGKKIIVDDIDSLPFPAYDLLNLNSYYNIIGKESRVISLLTSRDCPFQCTFCNSWRTYRQKSIEKVIEEIKRVISMGFKEIFFYDDTFNITEKRVIDLCRAIKKERLRVRWSFRGRCNKINEEVLEEAKEAGCFQIQVGVETGTDEGLAYLKKGITIQQIRNTFKWAKKYKIKTVAGFMIGLPFEKSRNDILKNLNFLMSLKPDYISVAIFNPRPHSEIYKWGIEKGLYDDYWKRFAANPSLEITVKFWEEFLTRQDLLELQHFSYKRFYLRPSYIFKSIIGLSSMGEIRRKIIGVKRIISWSK